MKERRNWRGVLNYDKLMDGYIRDIYHWNFLTDLQLRQPVGEQTLREWIQQEPDRGTMRELTKDVTFWKVDEEHRLALREQLKPCGVFFDQDKFYADMRRSTRKQEPMPFYEQSMHDLVKLEDRLQNMGRRRASAVAAVCAARALVGQRQFES